MACHMNKAPALAQRLRLQSRLPPPGLHRSPEAFRGTPWLQIHNPLQNLNYSHPPQPEPAQSIGS